MGEPKRATQLGRNASEGTPSAVRIFYELVFVLVSCDFDLFDSELIASMARSRPTSSLFVSMTMSLSSRSRLLRASISNPSGASSSPAKSDERSIPSVLLRLHAFGSGGLAGYFQPVPSDRFVCGCTACGRGARRGPLGTRTGRGGVRRPDRAAPKQSPEAKSSQEDHMLDFIGTGVAGAPDAAPPGNMGADDSITPKS